MQALIDSLTGRTEIISALVLGFLIISRLAFALFFTPFMGGRQVPARIKMGTAMALLFILYPALSKTLPEPIPINIWIIVGLFIKEAFIGLIMALMISMVFYGIQAAGQFIDNQRGISQAVIFNPALGTQASLSATFLFQLSVVLFFVIGGHRIFIAAIFQSYEILPVVYYPTLHPHFEDPSLSLLVRTSANVFSVSLQLAAPIIVAMFLSDVVLGVANRVAPQMDVLFFSYTLKAVVGLIMLFFAIHLILWQVEKLFQDHLLWIHEYIKGLPGT